MIYDCIDIVIVQTRRVVSARITSMLLGIWVYYYIKIP